MESSIAETLELARAVKYGEIDTVRNLLAAGADPSGVDFDVLIWCANYQYADIMKLLLDAGADPAAYDNKALYHAARYGHTEAVRVLLQYPHTDPIAGDNRAVKAAAFMDHISTVLVLVKHMQCSNICRYYYHNDILYIHYHTPPPGTVLLPGTTIWCSNPDEASADYVATIAGGTHRQKSAYSA